MDIGGSVKLRVFIRELGKLRTMLARASRLVDLV